MRRPEFLRWELVIILAVSLLREGFSQDTSRNELLALNQIYEVAAQGEQVISLKGRNFNGKKTFATIRSLPSSGTLYQLSYVFDKYGYEPKKGVKISSAPMNITSNDCRVLYLRPTPDREPLGSWDNYSYTVSDGFKTSLAGNVLIVPPSNIITASTFTVSAEEWKTIGNNNQRGNNVVHERTSRGNMSHYIYASDDLVNVDSEGNDLNLWSFLAPLSFTGWKLMAYGGTFEFTMSSFSGDFSLQNLNFGGNFRLIEIACETCDLHRGVTIGFPLLATDLFTGIIRKFTIPMHESAGWLKDPKNTLLPWSKVSQCEFLEVISNISNLKILGDFTKWYETVSIDDIQFRSATPLRERNIPKCAQWSPNVRECTCAPKAEILMN